MSISPDIILRHAERLVPRYTSYPTAPHFHAGVGPGLYRQWLQALPRGARLSLYLHFPFCDTLCWFCGCQTKITRQYAPISAYLTALKAEIDLIGALVPASARVSHIHWGGGSPTILSAEDSRRLIEHVWSRFSPADDLEFAVEVDPRGLGEDRVDALVQSGLTRVSVGVQDFDPQVQAAINRVQTFEETRTVIDRFRQGGVRSLNIDAIYGLPGQHAAEVEHTLAQVARLDPDRLALFGYAHVPWMKRHQSMIKEADLPGVVERHTQAELAAQVLERHGFERIGIDHFAKPDDALALAARRGRVQRNFQGYTVDPADALLGLGASAISKLPQGYVQNESGTAAYKRAVLGGELAAARGVALSDDDVVRGEVIERLLCDLAFDGASLRERFGPAAEPLIQSGKAILLEDVDGFVAHRLDGFAITDRGRPFARTIAARFDAYLTDQAGRHSRAV